MITNRGHKSSKVIEGLAALSKNGTNIAIVMLQHLALSGQRSAQRPRASNVSPRSAGAGSSAAHQHFSGRDPRATLASADDHVLRGNDE